MENLRDDIIENFLSFLEKRKLQLAHKDYYNNSFYYNDLEKFIKGIMKVFECTIEDEVRESLFYKFLKDYNFIPEFRHLNICSRYYSIEDGLEISNEKRLIDCVVSSIYQNFNKSLEEYLDTILCLKEIFKKYDCLDKAIEILESIKY